MVEGLSRVSSVAGHNDDPRLEEILNVIFRFAGGDLQARGKVSDRGDAVDGVMAGVNILGEELEAKIAENQRTQQALSESEAMLRTIFDSLQDGIILAEAGSRRFRMVNSSICRMLGYSVDELLKVGVEGIHPENDLPYVMTQFERLAKGEIGLAHNLPMKRKNGTVFYADVNTGPMVVGGIPCLVGVFRDITERKQQEQALRDSEEMLRTIASSAQDAIVMLDNDGIIALWNDAATKIFGHSSVEALGKNMHLLLAPARFHEAYLSGFRHFRSTGEGAIIGKTLELVALRKDGTEFPIELSLSAVKLRDKWSATGIMRDITERKLQQQALLESEERFRSILDNVVEIFFIIDASLRVEYVSQRFQDIFGYSVVEFIARNKMWIKNIHPEDRGNLLRQIRGGPANISHNVSQFRVLRKDGQVRWVRAVSNAIKGNDGKLQKIYGTLLDITEFESLRSSLKEKEVLLKEIHHRVKNNLQIVVSLLRLESRAFSDERILAVLADLETRIRAMALVHEHLYHSSDLSKIGFKDYLKGLSEELFRTYHGNSGRIRFEIDAEAVALDIERAIPCALIVNELLTNAIKYAFPDSRQGVLSVVIHNISGNQVEIVIADDGIGLPKEVDIRNTKTLGLQLVTTLVENQLKGNLVLDRENGSRFRIRFAI